MNQKVVYPLIEKKKKKKLFKREREKSKKYKYIYYKCECMDVQEQLFQISSQSEMVSQVRQCVCIRSPCCFHQKI